MEKVAKGLREYGKGGLASDYEILMLADDYSSRALDAAKILLKLRRDAKKELPLRLQRTLVVDIGSYFRMDYTQAEREELKGTFQMLASVCDDNMENWIERI